MIQTLNLSNNMWNMAWSYLEKMHIDNAAEENPDIYNYKDCARDDVIVEMSEIIPAINYS